MKIKNADMPAMPVDRCDADAIEVGIQVFSGLTKREMIAMHMMAGMLRDEVIPSAAKFAVVAADTLLAELESTK